MRWFAGVRFVMFLVLVGACAGGHESTPVARASAAPIINGTPLEGDLAVVALADSDAPTRDGIGCTGTLVSPHVVVAAGHCLDFDGLPAPSFVYFGDDPDRGGVFRKVRRWATHPRFEAKYTEDFRIEYDLGVVVLEDPAPAEAVPYLLARRAPTVGEEARFAGFGCREATGECGPFGVKYHVTTAITAVTETAFDYGVATCNGDSGGPAFVREAGVEVLAGVTSTGDLDCADYGVDTRVDAFAGWIDRTIWAEDPEACTGADCPCAADERCTVACARPGNDPDCPVGCAADGACLADACPERDPDCGPGLEDGAECARDADCASGVCDGICRELCHPEAEAACGEGLSCLEQRFGAYACVTESGGCGCRVGGAGTGGAGVAGGVLLLLALALVRRRR